MRVARDAHVRTTGRSGGTPPTRSDRVSPSDGGLLDAVSEFAELCSAASNLADVEQDFQRRLAPFGVCHFVLVQAMDANRRPNGALISGPSNQEWRRFYFEEKWAKNDTLMKSGLKRLAPVTWCAFHKERALKGEPLKLYDAARSFGFIDGYFLPIHMLDGSVACVSLFSQEILPERGPEAHALHLMALHYSFAVRRMLAPKRPAATGTIALTPRQRECLQWVRAGKTDWEIGQIIGISEHTVIEHLDEARRRLGVRTRTQAVIEAVAFGLIHI